MRGEIRWSLSPLLQAALLRFSASLSERKSECIISFSSQLIMTSSHRLLTCPSASFSRLDAERPTDGHRPRRLRERYMAKLQANIENK